jgi:hypothetical protein
MNPQSLLPRLRALLKDETVCDMLLLALLQSAIEQAKALTWREALPEGLSGAVIKIALIDYNRLGAEGESRHAEGPVSINFDAMPEDLKRMLYGFRCAVCG